MIDDTIPLLDEVWHHVPHGQGFVTYEFFKTGVTTSWPRQPYNMIGYRGVINVHYTNPDDRNRRLGWLKTGDKLKIGSYSFRVLDSNPWSDNYLCTWDDPLNYWRVIVVKLEYVQRWTMARVWATLRIWEIVDFDTGVSHISGRPALTRIFGRKVKS